MQHIYLEKFHLFSLTYMLLVLIYPQSIPHKYCSGNIKNISFIRCECFLISIVSMQGGPGSQIQNTYKANTCVIQTICDQPTYRPITYQNTSSKQVCVHYCVTLLSRVFWTMEAMPSIIGAFKSILIYGASNVRTRLQPRHLQRFPTVHGFTESPDLKGPCHGHFH